MQIYLHYSKRITIKMLATYLFVKIVIKSRRAVQRADNFSERTYLSGSWKGSIPLPFFIGSRSVARTSSGSAWSKPGICPSNLRTESGSVIHWTTWPVLNERTMQAKPPTSHVQLNLKSPRLRWINSLPSHERSAMTVPHSSTCPSWNIKTASTQVHQRAPDWR